MIDRDGRMIVEAMEYPWSALGRLNTGGRGFCTGALVGARLVLATARCLYNRIEGRWWHAGELYFVAGYQRDQALIRSAVAGYQVGSGFVPGPGATLASALDDWSLVTLRDPVGRRAGWLAVEWLDRAALARLEGGPAVAVQAGYRRDWAHVVTVKVACADGRRLGPGTGGAPGCAGGPGEADLPFLVLDDRGAAVLTNPLLRRQVPALAGEMGRLPDPTGPAAPVPADTVQRLLRHTGFLAPEAADDGAALAAAIGKAERAFGLAPRGRASLALLGRLVAQAQRTFAPGGRRPSVSEAVGAGPVQVAWPWNPP